jgi:Clostripain family
MSANGSNRRWTVMIYLAGDNNLADECVHSLMQMKEVEGLAEERIEVLAQLDPKGSRLKSHRYAISSVSKRPSLGGDFQEWVTNKKKFEHPFYKDYSTRRRRRRDAYHETNTGSPVTLFDFVTWAIETYPADSYMLILAGHGGGSEKGYFLRDEYPEDALTIWEMQVALEAIKKIHNVEIDILGMDCCLMTMAEVSFQLKGLAQLIVGSEGYSPIAGWPYKAVLQRVRDELRKIKEPDPTKRKELERIALANGAVEEYVNYYLEYSIGGLSVEQSSLDLRQIDKLKYAIDTLARALTKDLPLQDFRNAIVLAHWEAQSFNGEQFVDLYDFCDLLKKYYAGKDVVGACQLVLETESIFVTRSCYSGPLYQYSRGLSIYFPWAEIDPDYYAVRFAFDYSAKPTRRSAWMEFLEQYVVTTRRPQRHGPAELFGDNNDPYSMRHGPGRHGPGRMGLPQVLSMRNPPLSVGLSPCLGARPTERKVSLDRLSKDSKSAVRFEEIAAEFDVEE